MQGDRSPERDGGAEYDGELPHLVFVYGTLTDPERVDDVLDSGRYALRGEGHLAGLRRVDGEYPTLVPGGAVVGRLLAVDGAGLDDLDGYEGVDRGLYVRVAIPARLSKCGADDVWCYVGAPDRLDAPGAWPGDGSFESRVRAAIDVNTVVVTDLGES